MKHFLGAGLLCTVFLLSGCTVSREVNLQDRLTESINRVQAEKAPSPDHHKKFYSYALAPEVGRMQSGSTGNLFNYEGTEFLMNLNISSVINQKYYSRIDNDPDILNHRARKAYVSASYQDPDGDNHDFSIAVYDLGQQNYLTVMRSDAVNFSAVSDALKTADLAAEMLKMARSVKVDTDAVAAAYSRKETVMFTGERIQLFDSAAPESGRVEELFEDSSSSDGMEESSRKQEAAPSPSASGE